MFCNYCGDLLGTRGYIKWEGKCCCMKVTCLQRARGDGMEGLIELMGQTFGPQEGEDEQVELDVTGGGSNAGGVYYNLYQTLGRRYEDGT